MLAYAYTVCRTLPYSNLEAIFAFLFSTFLISIWYLLFHVATSLPNLLFFVFTFSPTKTLHRCEKMRVWDPPLIPFVDFIVATTRRLSKFSSEFGCSEFSTAGTGREKGSMSRKCPLFPSRFWIKMVQAQILSRSIHEHCVAKAALVQDRVMRYRV